MRSSKELAARLRFDRFPRLDFFRRRYFLAGTVVTLAGLGLWYFMTSTGGHLQYMPGPVTQNHATFGERCESCHDPFENIRNDACLACHPSREHSPFVVQDADCRDCHVEHLGDEGLLDVGNQACVTCHGDLETKRDAPLLKGDVASFATHPEFAVLRAPGADPGRIRFNHNIHLTSDKVRQAAPESEQCAPYKVLECASCHQLQADGMLMRKVTFDQDCRCCHAQEVQGPLGSLEAPHEEPEVVRRELGAKLLTIAVGRGNEIFSSRETQLPGVRDRGPIDESRSLAEYERTWVTKLETALYEPFRDEAPLLENNKYCFLCHDADKPYVPGVELPVVAKTGIPLHWLKLARFGHRKHEMVRCEDCHATSRQSALTSDVGLPGKALCEQCHAPDPVDSAGVQCVLCHLYHDTTKDPAQRAGAQLPIPIAVLLGAEAPQRGGMMRGQATPGVPPADGAADDGTAAPAEPGDEPAAEPAPADPPGA